MTTVTEEKSFMQVEPLMDKIPVSSQMQDDIEVMSTNDAMDAEESPDEELDLHVCGKCKTEFTNIQLYVDHKRMVCLKASPAKIGNQDSPSKPKRRQSGKQIISSTSAVTAIIEPHEQSFCETVIEEGVVADDTGSEETHQEIIKAARALENENDDEKMKDIPDKKTALMAIEKSESLGTSEGEPSSAVATGQVFRCSVCDKEFDRPETLVVHQFMHKKFHQCTDCKRSFVSEENLNRHKKEFKHVFKCKICMVEFPSQEMRKAHELSHTRQHECVDCKKKFYTEKTLERHREKVQHNLPCDKCEKICRDKHALTKHQESHMRVKSHVCDFEGGCERGFRTASELAKHKKCVHLGIKEHKCVECGKEFARKDKLNRHLLIHSPNRPTYPCPFKTFTGCVKTFYRKDKLQRHIFAHSKEKPYKCDTCAKLFARKDNLTEHTRIHTGEFKHRCPVCNKGMGGPKKLLLHIQQKHSGANETIPEKPTMVDGCLLPPTTEVATITTATADASAASWVEANIAEPKQEEQLVKSEVCSELPERFTTDRDEEQPEEQPEHMEQQQLASEGVQTQPPQQHYLQQSQHSAQQLQPMQQQQQHQPMQQQHQPMQQQHQQQHQPKPEQHQHDSEQSQVLQQHIIQQQQVPPQQQQQQHHHQQQQQPQQVLQQQQPQQVLQQHIIEQQQVPPQQQHEPQTPPRPPPPPLQQHQQQQPHVHPSQLPPTTVARVAVHYLANNNSPGQARGHYVPALHPGGQHVTQSETALLHEVLSELATRSLFNS